MKDEIIDTKEEILILKKARNLAYASRGVWVFAKTTFNVKLYIPILLLVGALGYYFQITSIEWCMVVLASGLVIVTEAVNSAIEIDINLTSPEYHPYARDTKDVAAGAVLIASVFAGIVGAIIFLPHILRIF